MASTMTRYTQPSVSGRTPSLIDRFFSDNFPAALWLDRSYGGTAQPTLPVNLFETGDSYVMHLALPGLQPEGIDIQVTGREVAVRGKFELNTPENGTWLWQGIPSGDFYETFTLPVDIDRNGVQASYDYGILTIGLPKADHVKPKSIKVQVSK